MNPAKQDFILEKHVFKMVEIETASACEVNCFMEADCVSYNLKLQQNGKLLSIKRSYILNARTEKTKTKPNERNMVIFLHFSCCLVKETIRSNFFSWVFSCIRTCMN